METFTVMLRDDAILWPDLDHAIIGVDEEDAVAVYSFEGIIEGLQAQNPDWDRLDAIEWYDFNIASLLPGKQFRVVVMEVIDDDD
jgi:hypothetical protein